MAKRIHYEMSKEDLAKILDASKPVPLIALHLGIPRSPQENANRAWEKLGEKLGFEHMTVRPAPGGNRFFTAVPTKPVESEAGGDDGES